MDKELASIYLRLQSKLNKVGQNELKIASERGKKARGRKSIPDNALYASEEEINSLLTGKDLFFKAGEEDEGAYLLISPSGIHGAIILGEPRDSPEGLPCSAGLNKEATCYYKIFTIFSLENPKGKGLEIDEEGFHRINRFSQLIGLK
jgi:hypothetical protein